MKVVARLLIFAVVLVHCDLPCLLGYCDLHNGSRRTDADDDPSCPSHHSEPGTDSNTETCVSHHSVGDGVISPKAIKDDVLVVKSSAIVFEGLLVRRLPDANSRSFESPGAAPPIPALRI